MYNLDFFLKKRHESRRKLRGKREGISRRKGVQEKVMG
jgi:hypothetical protein